MSRGLTLANKTQALFGLAVALIIIAALAAPWLLVRSIIDRSAMDTARQAALLWPELPADEYRGDEPADPPGDDAGAPADQRRHLRVYSASAADLLSPEAEGFPSAAAAAFAGDPEADAHTEALSEGSTRLYRYARPVRDEGGGLIGVVWAEHDSPYAAGQLLLNRAYFLAAGLVAGAVAAVAFYLITTRVILKPVKSLRDAAERVRSGDLAARVEIETGDEFEQLAEAFNAMLAALQEGRARLEAVNASLDLKVSELEQANISLHESARTKDDFVASVSHELRTPLNSIIGFAQLLEEIAEREAPNADADQRAGADHDKRLRYLRNIVDAGRSLLEMINELLDMARIEAGKVDLHVERMSVAAACQGLVGLIRPQADRKGVSLHLDLRDTSPNPHASPEAPSVLARGFIETDPRKFQQIVFNFLSNAVKFTPPGGEVTLRTERVVAGEQEPRIRVSVLDTGPGVPPEERARIFEKFTRVESGHAREHSGTGLGLAIAKELASMIQGEIHLESEVGQGSMFSLLVPERMDPDRAVEMTLQTAGVGARA